MRSSIALIIVELLSALFHVMARIWGKGASGQHSRVIQSAKTTPAYLAQDAIPLETVNKFFSKVLAHMGLSEPID